MKRINRQRSRMQNRQRKLRLEPLEGRLCLAASLGWDGPGLGAAALSYYVGDVPAGVGIEQAEVETAIETALDAWAQVADLTFTQTTLARQSDSLDITFTSIDGSGGVLAQAYLPHDVNRGRLAGDIEFDLADPWEVGNGRGSAAFDFVYVAVHEIGHALGLDHLQVVGSVMRPNVSPSQVFTTLSTADVNEILGVYAAAPSVTPDAGNPNVGNPNTGNPNTGGTDTTDQGGDTTNDGSSSDDNTSGDDEVARRRGGGGRGRFGRGRGRSGRATIEVLSVAPSHHNSERPGDVNNDQTVSALDALMIINDLNKYGPRGLSFGEGEAGSTFSMIDNGPLTEDHEGCDHGSRDPLARFDANEDGLLTVDEVPGILWARLLSADTDEDRAISPAELEAIAGEHHRGDPFERFDTNEDGALTIDEVPERLWERLSPADADEDGAVTADELAAARNNAGGDSHPRCGDGGHDRHFHR